LFFKGANVIKKGESPIEELSPFLLEVAFSQFISFWKLKTGNFAVVSIKIPPTARFSNY
jgi:hypothetical protein